MRANPESSSKLNACIWISALASLGRNDNIAIAPRVFDLPVGDGR